MRKMTILMPALAGVCSIFLASPVWAQGPAWNGANPCGPHMMGWHGGWGGMILGPLLMILVPVALIIAVLLAVRRFWPSSTGPSSAQQTVLQTPLDILKERFARGDIDKQEYEDRRRILNDQGDDT
ncbi:MAG: SHOCT domain-containing protein [Novosphingobium sp.]